MQTFVDHLLSYCVTGKALPADEAREILPVITANIGEVMACARLLAWRNNVRPFTCGIINAKSGHCAENCAFCAQSSHHAATISVHPLISVSSLYSHAERLASHGVTYMGIVTSGTSPNAVDFEKLCEAASRITATLPIKLCASLGLITVDQAVMLKQAGFTSYHHNLETSIRYYPHICSTHRIEQRLRTIMNAVEAGLRVCAGGIFGIGENWSDRIELSELLTTLKIHSIPINFLIPIPGTPLANRPPLSPAEALGIIVLFRLMHPSRDVVLCGGSTQTLKQWKPCFYQAGANGLMVGNYLTTKGNPIIEDLKMLQSLEAPPCPTNS